MQYEGYYTKTELKKRGWTIKLFDDHLPEPHKKVPNPINPDWAQMGLYDKKIVEKIEADSDFQNYKHWAAKHSARMREVALKRKDSRTNV